MGNKLTVVLTVLSHWQLIKFFSFPVLFINTTFCLAEKKSGYWGSRSLRRYLSSWSSLFYSSLNYASVIPAVAALLTALMAGPAPKPVFNFQLWIPTTAPSQSLCDHHQHTVQVFSFFGAFTYGLVLCSCIWSYIKFLLYTSKLFL